MFISDDKKLIKYIKEANILKDKYRIDGDLTDESIYDWAVITKKYKELRYKDEIAGDYAARGVFATKGYGKKQTISVKNSVEVDTVVYLLNLIDNKL